ncbi:MAG: hypothetical protein WCG01_00530 [bacterium]
MKKLLSLLLLLFVVVPFVTTAAPLPVDVYFFNGAGCPHCAKEEVFLSELVKSGAIKLHSFEVWHNQDNAELMGKVGKALNVRTSGVPLTIVGNKYVIGFDSKDLVGKELLGLIALQEKNANGANIVSNIIANKDFVTQTNNYDVDRSKIIDSKVAIPFLGQISAASISLPILTIIVGLLDSLNPCAMWVLLFLIGILLNMNDRKKMWLLGAVFLISSALAYFVFLAAWLNIYQFMSYIRWINYLIAALAIGTGLFSFWDFWVNRNGGCDISGNPTRRKLIMDKIKNFAQNESFFVAMFGLAAVGAGVNMIELLCSAGLPAVYIPILTATAKTKIVYYLYLFVYCFFYILPQLIIFIIAMFSLKQVALGSRVTRWFSLVSAVLMITVGMLLLFRPNLLAIFQ